MKKSNDNESVYTLVEQAMQAASSGNLSLAEKLLLRSYGTLEAEVLHNAEMRARVLHLLANSYRDQGKLEVARGFYQKARASMEKESLSIAPLALCEDSYVQSLYEGDLELALRSQQDLCASMQKCNFQASTSRLKNLLRLCALCWTHGKYFEAERCLNEYLQLGRQFNKITREHSIMLLCSLALLSLRTGKLEQAESLYKEALYAGNELQIMSCSQQAEMLKQLGIVLCMQDRHAEAQRNCIRASELNEEQKFAEESIVNHFRAIADVYCGRGCMDDASRYCAAALDVYEFGFEKNKNSSVDKLILIFRRLGLYDDAEILEQREALIFKQKVNAG